jgi:hypothetical protein
LSSLVVGIFAYVQIALYLTPKSRSLLFMNMLLASVLTFFFLISHSLALRFLFSAGTVAVLSLVSLPSFREETWCKIYNILEQGIVSTTFIYLSVHLSPILSGGDTKRQMIQLALLTAFNLLWCDVNFYMRRNTFTLMPMPKSSYQQNFMISLLIYAIMLFCVLGGDVLMHRFLSDSLHFSVFLAMMVLTLEMAVLLLFVYAKEMSLREQRLRDIAAQNVLNKQYVDDFTRFRRNMEIFEHDQKHLISALQKLLEQGNTERAIDLLKEISGKMTVQANRYYCGNHIINAVLLDSAQRCEEIGVRFEAKVRISAPIFIGDTDMAALLMNITKNAIECCSKLEDKQNALIKADLYTYGDYFSVKCQNSIEKTPQIINGRIRTTKRNDGLVHGLGLESIRLITRKYKGNMEISAEEGAFCILATMENIKNPSAESELQAAHIANNAPQNAPVQTLLP